jgi:nucleoside-diphosphate-sugar epimerase
MKIVVIGGSGLIGSKLVTKLRERGEAHRVLPDPVEYNHAERFLAQYGLTKDELISRRGGSP